MAGKVVEVNLELGMPTVDVAITKMKNALTTSKGRGYKAVILIHGYGATGVGGSIKAEVGKTLGDRSMSGIVRLHTSGEHWFMVKREFLQICKDLKEYERRIGSNPGVTVVLLR